MTIARLLVLGMLLAGCGGKTGAEACDEDCKQTRDCGVSMSSSCESNCKDWLSKASSKCESSYVALVDCSHDFTCTQMQSFVAGAAGSCSSELGQVVEDCPKL